MPHGALRLCMASHVLLALPLKHSSGCARCREAEEEESSDDEAVAFESAAESAKKAKEAAPEAAPQADEMDDEEIDDI